MIARYAFTELGVTRIELWIEPANRASLRVAERAGFTREGLMRSFAVIAGERRDMLMYSRLADDAVDTGSGGTIATIRTFGVSRTAWPP